MAEGERTECSLSSRLLGCHLADNLLDLAHQLKVLGVCGPIDQKDAIDVTTGRGLVPCQRTKNDNARILRIDPLECTAKSLALRLSE